MREYKPLRSTEPDDVPQLLAMEYRLFPENAMSEGMLIRELQVGEGLVYDVMGELAGYALIRPTGDQLDLTRLGVDPECQRSGVGRLLLRAVIAKGKTIVLTVRKRNYGAIRFYRRHGFEIVGQLGATGVESWAMRRTESGDGASVEPVEESLPVLAPSETIES